MTLRQRYEAWKERDRIIQRQDLSVMDKVDLLRGRPWKIMERRFEHLTDAVLGVAVGFDRMGIAAHEFNTGLQAFEESLREVDRA